MLHGTKKVRVKSSGCEVTVQVWSYQGEIRYWFSGNWYNPTAFEEI
jgi:uncharacterized protein YodC (DUF2158 family)